MDGGDIMTKQERLKRFSSTSTNTARRDEMKKERDARETRFYENFKARKLSDARSIVGTCMQMCPEFERYDREVSQELHLFEMVPGTETSACPSVEHSLAVKKYRRSAAGKDPEIFPEDIRPPAVLKQTMDFLVGKTLMQSGQDYLEIYNFIRDRGRALRKDFKVQNHLKGPECVNVLERMTRFLIHSDFILCDEPESKYSWPQNRHQISDTLTTLMEVYDDEVQQGNFYPCEAEFRAYSVLLTLDEPVPVDRVHTWRPAVLNDERVQIALKIYRAYQNKQFQVFFRQICQPATTYLMACILRGVFQRVRSEAWRCLSGAMNPRDSFVPVSVLVKMFGLDDENQAAGFCRHWAFDVTTEFDGARQVAGVQLGRKGWSEPITQFKMPKSRLIADKAHGANHLVIVNGRSQEGLGAAQPDSGTLLFTQPVQAPAPQSFGSFGSPFGSTATVSPFGAAPTPLFPSKPSATSSVFAAQPAVQTQIKNIFGQTPSASPFGTAGTTGTTAFGSAAGTPGSGSVFGNAAFSTAASSTPAFNPLPVSLGSTGPPSVPAAISAPPPLPASIVAKPKRPSPEQINAECSRICADLLTSSTERISKEVARDVVDRHRKMQLLAGRAWQQLLTNIIDSDCQFVATRAVLRRKRQIYCGAQVAADIFSATVHQIATTESAALIAAERDRLFKSRSALVKWKMHWRHRVETRRLLAEKLKRNKEAIRAIPLLVPTAASSPGKDINRLFVARATSNWDHIFSEASEQTIMTGKPLDLPLLCYSVLSKRQSQVDTPVVFKLMISTPKSGSPTDTQLSSWLMSQFKWGGVVKPLRHGNVQVTLRDEISDTPVSTDVDIRTLAFFESGGNDANGKESTVVVLAQSVDVTPLTRSTDGGLFRRMENRDTPASGSSAVLFVLSVDDIAADFNRLNAVVSLMPRNACCPVAIAYWRHPGIELDVETKLTKELGLSTLLDRKWIASYHFFCLADLAAGGGKSAATDQLGTAVSWLAKSSNPSPDLCMTAFSSFVQQQAYPLLIDVCHKVPVMRKSDLEEFADTFNTLVDMWNELLTAFQRLVTASALERFSYPPKEVLQFPPPSVLYHRSQPAPQLDWNSSSRLASIAQRIATHRLAKLTPISSPYSPGNDQLSNCIHALKTYLQQNPKLTGQKSDIWLLEIIRLPINQQTIMRLFTHLTSTLLDSMTTIFQQEQCICIKSELTPAFKSLQRSLWTIVDRKCSMIAKRKSAPGVHSADIKKIKGQASLAESDLLLQHQAIMESLSRELVESRSFEDRLTRGLTPTT